MLKKIGQGFEKVESIGSPVSIFTRHQLYHAPTSYQWVTRSVLSSNSLLKSTTFFWNQKLKDCSTRRIAINFGLSVWTVVITHFRVILSQQHCILTSEDFADTSYTASNLISSYLSYGIIWKDGLPDDQYWKKTSLSSVLTTNSFFLSYLGSHEIPLCNTFGY